jgi:tetratricopeptide (TPR) repeat protein
MDPLIKHHLVVGREYYLTGEYAKAKEHLEAVLRVHDDYADVHNMMGVILYELGNSVEACAAFERAIALNPRYTEAALNLSVCYNELGRYDDAKRVYTQVYGSSDSGDLNKLDAYARGKIANMHRDIADAYVGVGLLEHAVKEYRKALQLCPTFVDIRTKLATVLRDAGRIDDALDELIAIREMAPDYLQARVQLGITLWRADRIPEARVEWQYVLEHDPKNRSCRVYLGMTNDPPS